MPDGRTWLPGCVAPPREQQPVVHLWSIRKDGRQLDCELRGHGEYGWEVQLLRNGDRFYGRRHPTHALAQAEADAIRGQYVRQGGRVIN